MKIKDSELNAGNHSQNLLYFSVFMVATWTHTASPKQWNFCPVCKDVLAIVLL